MGEFCSAQCAMCVAEVLKDRTNLPRVGLWTRTVTLTVLAWLLAGLSFVFAESSTEPLHVQAGRAVFRLEHQEIISRAGQATAETSLKPDGTAFAVRHDGQTFLVTARHVAERPYDLRARVPAKRNDTGATEVVELRVPKEPWVFHEQGPVELHEGSATVRLRGVDVAIAPLPGIKDRGIVVFGSCDPCPSGESSQLASTDPTPPSSVLVTGFPGDLGFDLLEQRPMFRSGIIALVAGEHFLLIDGVFADERSFIIDRKVQRGNSGSPVFSVNRLSGAITLVGLVSATNDAWDYTIAEPASRSPGDDQSRQCANTGEDARVASLTEVRGWRVGRRRGWQPNKAIKLPVRPIMALANDASVAPGWPAAYGWC